MSFGYDANGNTTSKTGPTTYQYDYESQLTKIIYPDGSKNWFEYDGEGLRQSKRNTASAVRFIYDGIDMLQEINNITGLTSAEYLHGTGGVLKQRQDSVDHWYLFDGLGSTRALTDSGQAVTDTYSYEAFGNILASTGSSVNPYRYVGGWGYYADDESDLMLLTMRYYASDIGRFTTEDLIGQAGGLNLYVYTENSPINAIDPLGLMPLIYGKGVEACSSYYNQRYEESGCEYYRSFAEICCREFDKFNHFPKLNWGRCVRQCLMDYDRHYCSKLECCDEIEACAIASHFYCYLNCYNDSFGWGGILRRKNRMPFLFQATDFFRDPQHPSKAEVVANKLAGRYFTAMLRKIGLLHECGVGF